MLSLIAFLVVLLIAAIPDNRLFAVVADSKFYTLTGSILLIVFVLLFPIALVLLLEPS